MALLLALLLALVAPAQTACKRCKDTRFVVCPAEARHACKGTSTRRCSLASACPSCVGTHRVPCPKCAPTPSGEYIAEQEANRVWLASRAPIDTLFGRTLTHAQGAHFELTFDVEKLDASGGGDRHGGLHVYLDRLEALFALVSKDLGAVDTDYLAPTQVFLWGVRADQEKAALHYTRQSSSTEAKLMGKAPVVTIFYDHEWLHEEFELHQAVVHQVVHCLLSNVWDGIWPGNIRAGWLDEGLAHAYEMALFGEARHYCYVESDTILDLKRGSWEPPVRAAVDQGKAPSFVGVAGKNTTELEKDDQPFAWSYVDFVRRVHPDKLGPLARALKAKKPLKDALAETFALTPFQFEEAWQAFVRTTYAVKEKKKRG